MRQGATWTPAIRFVVKSCTDRNRIDNEAIARPGRGGVSLLL